MFANTPGIETFQSFAIALLLGALIGVEHEKHKVDAQKPSFAGIRTFVLLSEAGALSAWLSQQTGISGIFAAALAGLVGLIVAAYVLEKRADASSVGLTTELAALTAFLLGAAVMFGHVAIAVALAVVNTSLLAFKDPLHAAVQKLGKDDIFAGLKLLIASFIVLPLLPSQTVDPWDALNPYKLWLLVTLISALSLVGYVAIRWLGPARGVAVTGLTGGLVSSTATTLSLARESRQKGDAAMDDAYAGGVLIAWSVMFVRILVMVAIINPGLIPVMLWPFVFMLLVNTGFALTYYWRSQRSARHHPASVSEVPLKNPFSLWSASKFGMLFAVVLLLVGITRQHFSSSGMVLVAILAGTTDVDAITLSMADLAREATHVPIALQAVVAATLSNTVVKAGMTMLLGSHGLGRRMLLATLAVLVTGLLTLLWR
ncbi:MAG: hypothetical protein CGU29_01760 [Candidatus Dactylopiibacterium carminicum]|uniref:Uncharacterized protein n=1 Tax=Candidatus Dactylopiibacterium carminicum TaxID=857335 RepID=A0A272EYN6_9RHOO|nr:MgtC/SapB family protein [Candidatus Dactylopiibacterium carminicum]KAF7600569.1 hypothetical protein BGI27_01410 [Candidatus Dactylopiibacterium carminicum]PAS95195.1 MAG: hypothetical protein CGU29_01760 [Candidatus Dactylopiibacterium carminicum]PAT00574.1 MAG: hypothetical protein BSR46_01425 [Candidatus Dactylopiibacterium carminicum]